EIKLLFGADRRFRRLVSNNNVIVVMVHAVRDVANNSRLDSQLRAESRKLMAAKLIALMD
ncbi:hypothetical protein, partial [Klebsiella oxytoca]|uniref:hypothetical protein n=1 Tax=Klebsiella oxytoca TaxID=571 RepID=UPI001D0F0099